MPDMDTAKINCRVLFDVLTAHGLRAAVASPGSRNAPLLMALSARPQVKTRVVVDERTAAFVALGMAMTSDRPVMLCCTSGSALLNYAPAVAEAFHRHVPLIVVSADRPRRWIDQNDSQTMRQPGALRNIVKKSFDIPVSDGESVECGNPAFDSEYEWYVNRIANEAWLTATSGIPGPVHINVQIDAPIGETAEASDASAARKISIMEGPRTLTPEQYRELAASVIGKKILVVAGFMNPDSRLNKSLAEFLQLPQTAICAEPLSNLHLAGHPDACVTDLVLTADDETIQSLRPDVIISIGGAVVSSRLKHFLRSCPDADCWTLGDTDSAVDCYQSLTLHIEADPGMFFRGFASIVRWMKGHGTYTDESAASDYSEVWHNARHKAIKRANAYIGAAPWSELKAMDILMNAVPRRFNLFFSNGTAVRYAGLGMAPIPHACWCNRGISGIEGGNATAVGTAVCYAGPTILITGDMSFSYAPEIMGLDIVPDDFKIVVLNNGGGGIFRCIGATSGLPIREEMLCAPRQLPLEGLCRAYGWDYLHADSETALKAALPDLFGPGRLLLEVSVDPSVSASVFTELFRQSFEPASTADGSEVTENQSQQKSNTQIHRQRK